MRIRRKDYIDLIDQAKRDDAIYGCGKFVVYQKRNMWYAQFVIAPPIGMVEGMEYFEYDRKNKRWVQPLKYSLTGRGSLWPLERAT